MFLVEVILLIILVYLVAGFVFAIPFVLRGVDKIDEGAHGGSWGFRLIIIPGAIVFWPLLLRKWIKISKAENAHEEPALQGILIKPLRKRHLQVWTLWAILIPAGIIIAWMSVPEQSNNHLLQPAAGSLLPVIVKTADKKEYTVNLRTTATNDQWQLEWINKEILTCPTATIYMSNRENKNIEEAKLIGRIEARGTYQFSLDSTFQPFNLSTDQLVLYDFIHKKIIDSITFKPNSSP